MRDRHPKRLRRATAAAVALAMTLAWGAGRARAQGDEEETSPADATLGRRLMKVLGRRGAGAAMIDSRGRAPLVGPPSRDLPPPRDEAGAPPKPAAWPKDPDVNRRK